MEHKKLSIRWRRITKSEKQVNNAAFEEQDGTQNYYLVV